MTDTSSQFIHEIRDTVCTGVNGTLKDNMTLLPTLNSKPISSEAGTHRIYKTDMNGTVCTGLLAPNSNSLGTGIPLNSRPLPFSLAGTPASKREQNSGVGLEFNVDGILDLSSVFAGLQINTTTNPNNNPNNTTNITAITASSESTSLESRQLTTNIINRGTGAGGANTNATGLSYEAKTDLSTDYIIIPIPSATNSISLELPLSKYPLIKFTGNDKKFIKANKYELHKIMTDAKEINTNLEPAAGCKNPDEAYIAHESKRIYIIEKKFQQTSGSVDEKIQTGVFKKYHYGKLFPNYHIEYIYCLSDWFKKAEYKSVLDYLADNAIPVFWGNDPDYKQKIIKFMCAD